MADACTHPNPHSLCAYAQGSLVGSQMLVIIDTVRCKGHAPEASILLVTELQARCSRSLRQTRQQVCKESWLAKRFQLCRRPEVRPQHHSLAHVDVLTSGAVIDALTLWQQQRSDVKRLELVHEKLKCAARRIVIHKFWEDWKLATGGTGARVIACMCSTRSCLR